MSKINKKNEAKFYNFYYCNIGKIYNLIVKQRIMSTYSRYDNIYR